MSRSRYGASNRGGGHRSGTRTDVSWVGATGESARQGTRACGRNTNGGGCWADGYYRCSTWTHRRNGGRARFRTSSRAVVYSFSGGGNDSGGCGCFKASGGSCSSCSYGRASWSWRGGVTNHCYGYSGNATGGTCRTRGSTHSLTTERRLNGRATTVLSGEDWV